MYKKAVVIFTFEVDDTKSEEQIKECINFQLLTDMNVYWQNDDHTAQMTDMELLYGENYD